MMWVLVVAGLGLMLVAANDVRVELSHCPTGAQPLLGPRNETAKCLPRNTNLCLRAAERSPSPPVGNLCCWHNNIDYYCCVGVPKDVCPSYSDVTVVIQKGTPEVRTERLVAMRRLLPSLGGDGGFTEVENLSRPKPQRPILHRDVHAQIPRLFFANSLTKQSVRQHNNRERITEKRPPVKVFRRPEPIVRPIVIARPAPFSALSRRAHPQSTPTQSSQRAGDAFLFQPRAFAQHSLASPLPPQPSLSLSTRAKAPRILVQRQQPLPVYFRTADEEPVPEAFQARQLRFPFPDPNQQSIVGPLQRYFQPQPHLLHQAPQVQQTPFPPFPPVRL